MVKRFTETAKWEDPWYRKLLSKHKLFWQFICDKCDNAGIWKIDYEIASFCIGEQITDKDMVIFNKDKERIIIKNGLLFIKDFIKFQIFPHNHKPKKPSNLQKSCLNLIKNYRQRNIFFTGNDGVSYPIVSGIGKGKGKGKGKDIKDKGILVGPSKAPPAHLSDADFLLSLKKNLAYSHIDLDRELAKMDAWLLTRRGRKKTRRFIVNWLNKIDKPLGLEKPKMDAMAKKGAENRARFKKWEKERQEEAKSEDEEVK